MLFILDPIINAIRAPLNAIRSAVFGVKSAKGRVKFDVSRLKGSVGEYGSELGLGGGDAAKAADGPVKKKKKVKKMGLFSKKKKCPSCGAKLHESWDTCPECGWGAKKAPAAAAGAPAPMAAPQVSSNQKARTVSINIGPGGAASGNGPGLGWLVPLEGEQTGELLQLKAQKTTVGSRPECDVVVKDQSISGKHAEFTIASGGFRVTDLGSTNGTFVNDKKVQTTDLVDNDNVRLGLINFKFKALN